jgi:hypothetical protein
MSMTDDELIRLQQGDPEQVEIREVLRDCDPRVVRRTILRDRERDESSPGTPYPTPTVLLIDGGSTVVPVDENGVPVSDD